MLIKAIQVTLAIGIISLMISVSGVFAETSIADFVDPNKRQDYYLDRYYNEPTYKSWFDRNYPGITIEEAVGINEIDDSMIDSILKKEIIPEADARLVSQEDMSGSNSEVAHMVLAIGGLGILFGAVWGIKRKVNDNSRQISINKESIKNKIIKPITRTTPLDILQKRLVRGEISVKEFEEIRAKLASSNQ
ncbi:MAG: SHOCT domain-containing protein [Nitrosopumilus sp.]|nr:MAG: SHOCT domain-containing protein [Nitrosopumilus sp.]